MMPVEKLMDTPKGQDEVGTPDEYIERCEDCRALYRKGGWHECSDEKRIIR